MASLLDWINANIEIEDRPLTKSEFKKIRNCGSKATLEDAVIRMEAAGGYDCLDD